MEKDQNDFSFNNLRRVLACDDVESLRSALDKGLDPKLWLDADSHEALLAIATLRGSVDCVELLLERGGDWTIDAPFSEDFNSPLAIALSRGSDEVLDIFIQMRVVEKYSDEWLKEAAKSLMDREGCGEVYLAFLEALFALPIGPSQLLDEPAVVKFLIKKINACKSVAEPALANRWSVIARALGETRKQAGLILAQVEELAASCHTNRLRELLDSIPPSIRSEAAGRALVYASSRRDWEFADELIEMGADCTAKLAGGATALIYAAHGGNLALIRKLLDRGADLRAQREGLSAIDMAQTPLIRRYLEKLASRNGK